jgi:hypothetical protein
MLTRFILALTLVISVHSLIAQYQNTFKLDKSELQLNDCHYYIDSVIDARNQGDCIGFTLKGMDFRQTAAYFEQPFCTELQHLFSRSLIKNANSSPLILRVNKFLLSSYYFSEMVFSIVEVNISIIAVQEGKYLELYRGMASSETSGSSGQGSISLTISRALSKCFNDFLRNSVNNLLSPAEIQPGELSVNPLYNHKYRIEKVDRPERGIYHTYSDFLNCDPDTLKPIKVEYIPGTEKAPEMANVVLANDNTFTGKIWGFSDGKTNFINIDDNYYPLYREDSTFRLRALREGTNLKDLSPYLAGALIGGLVGALFGFAVIPAVPDPVKDAIVEYQIELSSGLIVPLDLVEYKEMNSRMILYMSKYQKEENEMEIYLDGEFKCRLNRNNYYLLTIPPDIQQIELCLKSNVLESCETFKPIQYDAGVFICEVKNNQPPDRSEAKAEIRKSILDKISTLEITRSCPGK